MFNFEFFDFSYSIMVFDNNQDKVFKKRINNFLMRKITCGCSGLDLDKTYSNIATGRAHPALAPFIFIGNTATLKPYLCGSNSRFANFSI